MENTIRGIQTPSQQNELLCDRAPATAAFPLVLCFWIIAIAGIAVRVIIYLQNRSLWGDEAALATNILTRSFSQLHQPLANEQAAPLGFLYAVKCGTLLFGNSEFALRLVPLISGTLVFVLAGLFARRHLTPLHGLCMLILLAFSPVHIYYSAELKQYGTDLFVSFALIFASLEVVRRPAPTTILLWSFFASLCIWFSHPAIFMVPGSILVLVLGVRSQRSLLLALGFGAALIAVSFVANYFLITASIDSNRYLHDFWAESLRPAGGPADVAMWLVSKTRIILDLIRELVSWHIGLALLVVSLPVLWWRNRQMAVLCCVPVICALAAAMLRLYPFHGRFLFFTLPGLCILYSSIALLKWRLARILSPLLLLLAISPAYTPLVHLGYPPASPTRIRYVVEQMSKEVRPGDRLFVMGPTRMLFAYYSLRFDFSQQDVRYLPLGRTDATDGYEWVRKYAHGRCWVLCANFRPDRHGIPKSLFDQLDNLAPRQRYIKTGTAWASLYEFPTP